MSGAVGACACDSCCLWRWAVGRRAGVPLVLCTQNLDVTGEETQGGYDGKYECGLDARNPDVTRDQMGVTGKDEQECRALMSQVRGFRVGVDVKL